MYEEILPFNKSGEIHLPQFIIMSVFVAFLFGFIKYTPNNDGISVLKPNYSNLITDQLGILIVEPKFYYICGLYMIILIHIRFKSPFLTYKKDHSSE